VILLVTKSQPEMDRYRHPHLGRLVQPRHYSSIERTAKSGVSWAADNDAYGDRFDPEAYEKMLARLQDLPGCLFVACPDVLADASATLALFDQWRPRLVGLPVALVAQDGLVPDAVPWADLDALFIGGTDAFKLGPAGEAVVVAAQRHRKWVHIGRVNGNARLRYCATLRADSVDGSSWARWNRIWLQGGLIAVGQPRQPRLQEGAP
jgi:hypothetical protein